MELSDTFKSTYENFLSGLSTDDRARYNDRCTPGDLLDGLGKICRLSEKTEKSRFQMTLSVLNGFNERMKPFFAIMDSSVTQSCVYAGAALGALRLILELASCFPTFLRRLVECIKQLTESFPRYAALEEIYRGKLTPRLARHLGQVYRDLFDFFNGAASVFMSSNGKIKRPVELITTILWRPFDERFKDILVNMKMHQQALEEEIRIQQLSKTTNLATDVEQISRQVESNAASISDLKSEMKSHDKDITIKRVQTWLDPPEFATTYLNALDQRAPGTSRWILDMEQFQRWSQSTADTSAPDSGNKAKADGRVLWIHGKPGGGKTVLAASIIHELHDSHLSDGSPPDLFYFFFKYDRTFHDTRDAAYRAILSQILHKHQQNESLLDKFMFAIDHNDTSSGQLRPTNPQLKELLHLCLSVLDAPTLVLDGIDECVESLQVVNDLRSLLSIPALRVLLSSRPNVAQLTKLIPTAHRVEFGQRVVDQDIGAFCRSQLVNLLQDELLDESADITRLTQRLVLGADRMFLWARLMISLLHSPALGTRERENMIHSITLPEGLEVVYLRIFKQISRLDFAQRRMASRVIRWTRYYKQEPPLTLQEWHQLLGVEERGNNETTLSKISELITLVTCGLISLKGMSGSHFPLKLCVSLPVLSSFIHLSVLEHLSQWPPKEPDIARLHADTVIFNMEIAKDCLDHLMWTSPQSVPLGVHEGSEVSQNIGYLAYYTSVHWVSHLYAAIPEYPGQINQAYHERYLTAITEVCSTLEKFFEEPLAIAFWVQCFYSSSMAKATPLLRGGQATVNGKFILSIPYQLPQVLQWLAWAQGLPLADSLRGRFASLKQSVTSLLTDLTDITLKWAEKLTDSPSFIWTDVLLFTKSRYLPTSQWAYQVQMNTTKPTMVDSSSRRLCHVSTTSPDGKVLGVLSIWPSSCFEQFWQALDPGTAYSQVESHCEGWRAVYELDSIGEPMRRLGSITIPLQASEIALQMRQAFRQELTESWKASFPLSISPDGYSMSILRTVYRVSVNPSSSKLRLQSCLIPLQDIQAIQHLWDDKLERFDPEGFLRAGLPPTLQMLQRRIYTYCTLFNADGRYVFFQDSQRAIPPTLAVFEVTESPQDHNLRVNTVAVTQGQTKDLLLGQLQLATAIFHPTSMLVAYAIKDLVGIWDFSKNIRRELSRTPKSVTSLQLSTCKNYLIVLRGGIDCQEVFDLRSCISLDSNFPTPPGHSKTMIHPHGPKQTTTLLGRGTGNLVSEVGIIRAGEAVVKLGHNTSRDAGEGAMQGTSYHLGVNSGNLVLSCNSLAGDEKAINPVTSSQIQLLTFPDGDPTKGRSVTIYPPAASEHHMSILVNKELEPGYDLLDPRQPSLPALIRKDERSVSRLTVSEDKTGTSRADPVMLNPGVKRSFVEAEGWALQEGSNQLR